MWLKERCALLELTLVRVNHSHWTQSSMIAVSHSPSVTARIAADGNGFFWSVALMIHKSTIQCDPPCMESIESYMKQSRMQTLGIWATELEVIAAEYLLTSTIHIYAGKYSNGSSIHHRKLALVCIKMKAI